MLKGIAEGEAHDETMTRTSKGAKTSMVYVRRPRERTKQPKVLLLAHPLFFLDEETRALAPRALVHDLTARHTPVRMQCAYTGHQLHYQREISRIGLA